MSFGLDSQNGRWVGVARMAVGWLAKMGFVLVRWLTTMGYVSGGQNAGSDVCVAVFGVFFCSAAPRQRLRLHPPLP